MRFERIVRFVTIALLVGGTFTCTKVFVLSLADTQGFLVHFMYLAFAQVYEQVFPPTCWLQSADEQRLSCGSSYC